LRETGVVKDDDIAQGSRTKWTGQVPDKLKSGAEKSNLNHNARGKPQDKNRNYTAGRNAKKHHEKEKDTMAAMEAAKKFS